MTTPGPDRQTQATLADVAAAIERRAADLAIVEEPSAFLRALETEPGDRSHRD
jgi:hypothetical protein